MTYALQTATPAPSAAERSTLGRGTLEPVRPQLVEVVGTIELQPVRCVVDSLIAPWSGDLALRIAHLAFGEREVAIAPHAEYGQGRRTVMTRQHLPDIAEIAVEACRQSSGTPPTGDPRFSFRLLGDRTSAVEGQ